MAVEFWIYKNTSEEFPNLIQGIRMTSSGITGMYFRIGYSLIDIVGWDQWYTSNHPVDSWQKVIERCKEAYENLMNYYCSNEASFNDKKEELEIIKHYIDVLKQIEQAATWVMETDHPELYLVQIE